MVKLQTSLTQEGGDTRKNCLPIMTRFDEKKKDFHDLIRTFDGHWFVSDIERADRVADDRC